MTSPRAKVDRPESDEATVSLKKKNEPMNHGRYLEHLETYLGSWPDDKLQFYEKQIHILKNLDLDPIIPSLISLYSPGKLEAARDPPSMLRSLILMTLLRITGITEWVRQTKNDRFLTVLIGFEPGQAPEVGTYYAFMKRMINGPYRKPCRCKDQVKRSQYNTGPHKRNLKQEKKDRKARKNDFDPNHSQSEKLAGSLLANAECARAGDFNQILEDLSIQLGLIPSIRQGLISNLNNLVVSGDGSILQTAASSRGKPTCNCRSEGIYKCDHDRYYTSPTAKWCYDHVRDAFLFGDRYYHLVTTQDGHDYPLLTYMPGGNESDYTLSLMSFDRMEKALRENGLDITVSTFIGDGHHDSYAHYHYFGEKNVIPIIPLSKPSQKAYPHLPDDGDTRLDTDGVPLCPAGKRMRRHCYDKKKNKHVFNCPAKRNTHRNGKSEYVFHEQDCPRQENCDPQSNLGPFVYLKSSMDPRLFPPLPRFSRKFKDLMNQRSASERCNFINDSYGVEGSSRNADYGLIRLTLANIAHHCSTRYR
ncbi:MAG: hypothetical protein GY737_10495, partial [Desulfobacteraceae bacterium]|nr:hypothetical protein [Desulfobacteraceae bacterium]